MPEIARFYGIVIKMFFMSSEHNPPHFHALYGEYMGEFDINNLKMIEGDLPPRAISIVLEWAKLNQAELLEMWNTQKIHKLQPLK
ncbi:MAG: DUF4160 domain-containing protein [Synergistaceae bacterium]|nr:DUF4160 domain-containing protein [Synergistaceae bacterium]MBQ6737706.1 DUF4160 domain-containing protein [Synergistaceae bacterium]MBQ7068624.1 DUF4160 domain-containing protein [Synergistaceae bacterium]MBR0233263.1 DUF4160 domain-containing protein [Synergistaceae bacterium]MBR0252999.1 DUF4160 domain-containing protein [Synergistaceae bacterium]